MKFKKQAIDFSLFALILMLPCIYGVNLHAQTHAQAFSYQIQCVGSVTGCPCYKTSDRSASSLQVYHMQAATPVRQPSRNGLSPIQVDGQNCFYPTNKLKKYKYASILKSNWRARLDHRPLPLSRMLGTRNPQQKMQQYKRVALGTFWPTYYHLALEDFHPGPKQHILDRRGRSLGKASGAFLKQVMWEGSGISSTGLRVHYTGKRMRFELYPPSLWGYGAGYGHRVWPYRTIAVNFPGLCRALGLRSCGKKQVIGTLVWIKNVADKKIKMSGGNIHDGYFCATDTGSPNYIKRDRIDIFVGVHGGGNPYLPPERRSNLLYDAGLKSLVPHDWRLWRSSKQRVWCDWNRLPGKVASAKACRHDYHTHALDRALQLYVLKDARGAALRCKPGFPALN